MKQYIYKTAKRMKTKLTLKKEFININFIEGGYTNDISKLKDCPCGCGQKTVIT